MSIESHRIFECIEATAPRQLAEEWDNVGLSVGSYHQQVSTVLTTLDVTEAVVDEAIANHAELIVSHHPLIFRGMKRICFEDYKGALIQKLICNHISVYSAHTNLDAADEGLNTCVAERLGLEQIKALGGDEIIGKIGVLSDPVSPEIFLEKVKSIFEIPVLRTSGPMPKRVRRVAICTGSGAAYMDAAKSKRADVFITGDVKYHDAQRSAENGIWIIDAGHYGTEKLAGQLLKKILRECFSEDELKIIVSSSSQDYFHYH